MTNITFYRCPICGNIVMKILNSGVPVVCCGQPMQEMIPNTTDASNEKHVPVVAILDKTVGVSIGVVPHPMTDEHYIQWVYLETDKGGQLHYLHPNEEPETNFPLADGETPLCVYSFCNLHSLWMREIDVDKDKQYI